MSFTITPVTTGAKTVRVDIKSTNRMDGFYLDYGDGETYTGDGISNISLSHTYSEPGTYTITAYGHGPTEQLSTYPYPNIPDSITDQTTEYTNRVTETYRVILVGITQAQVEALVAIGQINERWNFSYEVGVLGTNYTLSEMFDVEGLVPWPVDPYGFVVYAYNASYYHGGLNHAGYHKCCLEYIVGSTGIWHELLHDQSQDMALNPHNLSEGATEGYFDTTQPDYWDLIDYFRSLGRYDDAETLLNNEYPSDIDDLREVHYQMLEQKYLDYDDLTLTPLYSATGSTTVTGFDISYSPGLIEVNDEISFSVPDWGEYYYWTFGDGTDSYDQNPDHTYTTPGSYPVTCLCCDSTGQNTVETSVTLVVLDEGGIANPFYAKPYQGTAPLTTQFISVFPDSVTAWLWDFGDGETSTDQYPDHTYDHAQDYTVKLTVTMDSVTRTMIKHNYIHVSDLDLPVANFSHNLTCNSGSIPVSVEFTDESTGTITESDWDFGDGATSTEINPVHVYSSAGYYFVKRTVRNEDWIDERVQLFYIRPRSPTVRIHVSAESGVAPLTISCIPVILGAYLRLEWDFGDDTTSKVVNPSHTYSTPGTYTLTLTVWNTTTLYSTSATKTITVIDPEDLPTAAFSADVTDGAAPLTVTFTDASTETPTSWLWDFGDGDTSTDQNPEHVYSSAGIYTVSLTVTNSYGSDTETKTDYITAGAAPVAAINVDSDIHYLSHEFSFTDESENNPTSWSWDFGDTGGSSDPDASHTFAAARSYWVTLTVTNTYGSDSIGIDITVLPAGFPLPSFTYSTLSKKAPYLFTFTDTSLGTPTSWFWDFGDGNTSTDQNPTHTYQFSGRYVVSLTVSNDTGTATRTEVVLDGS